MFDGIISQRRIKNVNTPCDTWWLWFQNELWFRKYEVHLLSFSMISLNSWPIETANNFVFETEVYSIVIWYGIRIDSDVYTVHVWWWQPSRRDFSFLSMYKIVFDVSWEIYRCEVSNQKHYFEFLQLYKSMLSMSMVTLKYNPWEWIMYYA